MNRQVVARASRPHCRAGGRDARATFPQRRFMVPMRAKKSVEALHEPPQASNRSRLGKAALKTHALQTLTRGPLTWPRAKRLECVRFIRFIGALPPAWFMVPMHGKKDV